MIVRLFDDAWGEVDSQEVHHIRIEIDNSQINIEPIDEGIRIREVGTRIFLIMPNAANEFEIVTT